MNEPPETKLQADSGSAEGRPAWILRERFTNILDLTEQVQGWDIDFRQIDEGPLAVELLQVAVGACLLSRARFNRRFHQRGVSPAGMRTFGLLESGATDTSWGGRALDETSLIVFHPLGEFEAVAAAGFECYVLSFAEQHLVEVAEHFGLEDELGRLDGTDMVTSQDAGEMRVLRHLLRSFCSETEDFHEANPEEEIPFDLATKLEYEIPGRILVALSGSNWELRLPPDELRYLVAERAVAFTEENSHEVLTVEDLCRATRVSRRTLNYAFRQHLGITPKAYLKSMRLDAARWDLGKSGPGTKIADVANRHGFWHMGQFAADYRRQFGELPSETLQRAADTDDSPPQPASERYRSST